MMIDRVWVFIGTGAKFPSGVFSSKKNGEQWITDNKLSGVLTEYPMDIAIYEWAIKKSYFVPKKNQEFSTEFIQKFTSASQKHFHYENGSVD